MGFGCDKEETEPERWLVSTCYVPAPVIGAIDTFRVTDLPVFFGWIVKIRMLIRSPKLHSHRY